MTAVAVALLLARAERSGALVVDLVGDVPAALAVADPGDPGITGWLGAGPDVPADGLARLELDAGHGVALVPRGSGPLVPGRIDALAGLLAADDRPVVVDCGLLLGPDGAGAIAAASTHSLLVIRPCYLALRRAATAPISPSGVVLLSEEGRALGRSDVEHVVGAPVVAEIAVDPIVARTVDAGLLASRFPRPLERSLSRFVATLATRRAA